MADLHGHATTINANGSCRVTCVCGRRSGGHRTEEFALRELRRHLIRHGALIVVRSSMTGQTRDIPVLSRTVQLVRPTPSS